MSDSQDINNTTNSSQEKIEDDAQDWLLIVTDRDVTTEELAKFNHWYESNPLHKNAYDEVRNLWDDIDGLRSSFAPPEDSISEYNKKATHSLELPPHINPSVHQYRSRKPLVSVIFATCILFFLFININLLILWQADYSTNVGEQSSIILSDGSVAHLNTDTAIAVDYSEGRRQITLLQGEALFEVTPNVNRPFDVLTLDGSTTAVGTAFIVKQRGDSALVTVTEGTVRVASPIPADENSVVLTVGQQLSYQQGESPGEVVTINPVRQTAWRNGIIIIENQSMQQALIEVDRYRPGKILLLANTEQLEAISARISVESIDSGLEALAATHNLTITKVTDYLLIVR